MVGDVSALPSERESRRSPFAGRPAAEPARSPIPRDLAQTVDSLQASLVCLREQLFAQQRLAMLGTLSAMVAHEFNNLMTPVLAYAEDARHHNDVPAMRAALNRTVTHTNKAMTITRRLLELADGGSVAATSCVLAQIVQAALESSARPFERDGIDLRVDVPAELRVDAHALLLEQALLNLILNARQAMKGRRGPLTISARREGRRVVIEVRDSGTGITQEQIEAVINPFLAADALADARGWRSVGMGLNVCRLIAQQHGARIQASANAGRGCTFRLDWPGG